MIRENTYLKPEYFKDMNIWIIIILFIYLWLNSFITGIGFCDGFPKFKKIQEKNIIDWLIFTGFMIVLFAFGMIIMIFEYIKEKYPVKK
jgi:hypothetical protein